MGYLEKIGEELQVIGINAVYYGGLTCFFVGIASVTVHACNSMGIGPTSRLENQLVNIEQRISSLETKIQHSPIGQESLDSRDVYVPEGAYLLPLSEDSQNKAP